MIIDSSIQINHAMYRRKMHAHFPVATELKPPAPDLIRKKKKNQWLSTHCPTVSNAGSVKCNGVTW
jgi:hypothetical protein